MGFEGKCPKAPAVFLCAMTMLVVHAPAMGESLPCAVDTGSIIEDWQQWEKLTSTPVRSRGHSRNWVDIYVDELARDTYLSEAVPYAECARIVKPEYTDEDAEAVRKITIMVKMPAGYDPDDGDWWYGVAGPDGNMQREGRIFSCIACHRQAKKTDYTFSGRLHD